MELSLKENNVDVKDLLEAAGRHRAWLAGPFLVVLTVGATGAFLWPDSYVSSAVLRVMPPAASANLVAPVDGVPLAERVASLQQSILSRTTIAGLIETYKLYPSERARMPLEDVIERMRQDITVTPLASTGSGGNPGRHLSFRIAYAYSNRFDAHRVTQSLVSRFIGENARDRELLVGSVNQFLRDEFERAQADVEAIEARIATRRPGASAQDRPPSLPPAIEERAALGRARRELPMLETDLRAARERLRRSRLPAPPAAVPAAAPAGVQALELELERLLARYKPTHPDVERVRNQLDALRLLHAARPAPAAPPLVPDLETEERVMRAEGQVRAKAAEIARLETEVSEAARAQGNLPAPAAPPDLAIEGGPLARERELALQRLRDARRKLLEGESAINGNRRSLGETLEVVDAPSLPETPVAPNRPLAVGASLALGLLLGGLLAALREWNGEAIHTIRQLRGLTPAQILGGIPLIEDELARRRRHRVAFIGWASASCLSLVSIAGAALYHHWRQP